MAARCWLRPLFPSLPSLLNLSLQIEARRAVIDQELAHTSSPLTFTSMPSSSSRRTIIDNRGFAFVFPHLGLPDPAGEWVLLKAAIGFNEEILTPLVNSDILETPLRHTDGQTSLVAIDFEGALWVLPLLKPRGSPGAAPEFFTIKARRQTPGWLSAERPELPGRSDWIFLPMEAYAKQKREFASLARSAPQGQQARSPFYVIDCGTAADTRPEKKAKERKKAEKPMTEEEVLMGCQIFRDDWCREVYAELMREAAQKGDPSSVSPTGLKFRLRVHPAKNDDFRSLDYVVCGKDEDVGTSIAEERWLPLSPHATRPDAQRHSVNLLRRSAGKKTFSREEWPPTPT